MRQETEWGYIDWEYLPDPKNPKRWFSVGKTTILPGKRQPPHVHYGYEQFLYVLSGEVDTRFNGVDCHAKAGDYFILDADTTHESVNHSDVPYREIVVTNPIPRETEQGTEVSDPVSLMQPTPEMETAYRRRLNAAAENLKSSIARDISIPFCLFDSSDTVILKNDRYSAWCMRHCDPAGAPKSCPCYQRSVADNSFSLGTSPGAGSASYTCPHGVKLYLLPVIHNGSLAGVLRGGQHWSSGFGDDPSPEQSPLSEGSAPRYDTPYATELSIEKTLRRIVSSLQRYMDILDSVEALSAQKAELNSFMEKTSELERNLSTVEEKVTNLKIDHHFLFNTLNCLADLSLNGERMTLYQSIIDLSKLFRYTMAQSEQIVPLSREIEYLRSYLNLQKLRCGDTLSLSYDIDPACLDTPVPFNFLQPIAENAFTHAFIGFEGEKKVDLKVKTARKQTIITISNNGIPPQAEDVDRISLSWASGSGHGLSFIYDKLHACFGEAFDMRLSITKQRPPVTKVTVTLPK